MQDRKESEINMSMDMNLFFKIIELMIAGISIYYIIKIICLKHRLKHIQDIGEENIVEEREKELLESVKERGFSVLEMNKAIGKVATFFEVIFIIATLLLCIGFFK